MFFLFNVFSFENNDPELAARVKRAATDEKEFAALAKEFEKHNRFLASKVTRRFITESDDEWSVVLLAFFEAVKKYDNGRGSFTAFSDMVIRNRLIDHMRSGEKASRERPADMGSEPEPDPEGYADPASLKLIEESRLSMQREDESRELRQEIGQLNEELRRYGVSFRDLPAVSPKAAKTRRACAKAIMYVAGNSYERDHMRQSGRLPAKNISDHTGIPLKLLDKYRKYIIAVIVIVSGDYIRLQEFTAEICRQAGAES